jgi:hypothetical protein
VIAYNANTGEVQVTWGQYGQDRSSFGLPIGVAADGTGHLLVADADNHRVMKFLIPSLESGQ